MPGDYKPDEINIRIYRKERQLLGQIASYNEPMKKVLRRVLEDYQQLKAKQMFEMKHGKSKRNF